MPTRRRPTQSGCSRSSTKHGGGSLADPVTTRRRERERLLALARAYAELLAQRLPLVAVAVVGSVARGDFNVWSDVDVLVVAEHLPNRAPERMGLLLEDASPGIQPVGFTPAELASALRARNPLALEALDAGVTLIGEDVLERLAATSFR
jgi:hypothetical protein